MKMKLELLHEKIKMSSPRLSPTQQEEKDRLCYLLYYTHFSRECGEKKLLNLSSLEEEQIRYVIDRIDGYKSYNNKPSDKLYEAE